VAAGAPPDGLWQGADAPISLEASRLKDKLRPLKARERKEYLDLTKLDNAAAARPLSLLGLRLGATGRSAPAGPRPLHRVQEVRPVGYASTVERDGGALSGQEGFAVAFSPSSRGRLTDRDLGRFPDDTLFHRLARAVCHAGCLPRKELYEAWEMGRRVRRLFRGGRVVDLGGGHGLLAQVMLLLDDSSASALVVDKALPQSSARVHDALVDAWPRISGRIAFVASGLEDVEIQAADVVVSSHACGNLTDQVLDRAVAAGARVAVLPCCHDTVTCESGELSGWIDRPLAIDILRAVRLEQQDYRIWTQTIPASITPKNRLLLGAPMR